MNRQGANASGPMRLAAAVAAAVGLTGCAGPPPVLSPRGPAAERIAELWWVMFVPAAAVSLLVAVALLLAIRRSRRRGRGEEGREIDGRALVLGGGVVLPVLVLFPLLVYSFRVGTAVYPPAGQPDGALVIEVVGHQFWWEVRYPEQGVITANEIHVPVGRTVRFRLLSPDVIHSFWVPQLHGKIDMIPGRVNLLDVRAEEAGIFRGQCAEFCGMAHARMAFLVIAQPEVEFSAWVERHRAPAPEPAAGEVQRGRDLFFAAGCGDCHATRGVPLPPGVGQVGPDLSRLALRRTLAAGVLPNNRGALAGWIADPERIKPGSLMPGTRLPGEQMQALLTYLQSLR